MRFFSNEAKDNVEEQENTGTAVPQQRSGSPWQHHEPESATPTAGNPQIRPAGEDPDRTTPLPDTDRTAPSSDSDRTAPLPDSDRTAAFEDGSHRAEPVQVNPAPGKDGAVDDRVDADRSALDDPHATQPVRTGVETPRHAGNGDGVPDRAEFGATADQAADGPGKSDSNRDGLGKSDYDHEPVGVGKGDLEKDDFGKGDFGKDDRTAGFGTVATGDVDSGDRTADVTEPLVKPAPAAEPAVSGPAPFFPASDTQPLRDRWRDVQLRFVDDPKAATSEASGLVDEAVDKLTEALRDHRGSVAKGTDDTESLRVEFRSYRDILDRLLGL